MHNIFMHFKGAGLKAQLLRGISGTGALKIVNIIITLVLNIVLARLLGPKNYGVYTFTLSLIFLIGLPTIAGLPTLIVREIAKYQLSREWGAMHGLLLSSSVVVLVYSVTIAPLVIICISQFESHREGASFEIIFAGLWLLPLIALEGVRTGALRGLRQASRSQIPEQLVRPLVMLIAIGGTSAVVSQLAAVTAMWVHVFAASIAFLSGIALLMKALPSEVRVAKPRMYFKSWATALVPLSLFAGLRILDSQISVILLGIFGSPEGVGQFKVAASGAGLVSFALSVLNIVIAPQIARLYQAGDIKKLQRMVTLSTRAVVAISLPVALIFILWGREILALVFGPEYAVAATAMTILCVAELINSCAGSVALVLNMTGHDKKTLLPTFVALLLNGLLGGLLIPYFGVGGAAISYAVSLIVWNSILIVRTRNYTGINTLII